MSDTTEAMRAAFDEQHIGYEFPSERLRSGAFEHFVMGWRAARAAHPTPAAPAVTDSTHTGALPDAADLATHSWPIHEGGMRIGVPNGVLLVHKPTGIGVAVTRHRSQHQNRDEARTRLFGMLAAQPSPERNDCKPVAPGWKQVPQEATEAMKAAAVIYANGSAVYKNVGAEVLRIEEAIYGEVYEAMLAAAPPPAERNYCERRGKRLGSTLGVHTCTPPGESVWEQCAKIAEDDDHVVRGRGYYDQLGDADATARNIAAAIRAAATKEPQQ